MEKLIQAQHDAMQFGKTPLCIEHAKFEVLQAIDPKAAERAKRYLWSRIERSSGRAKQWRSQ